MSKELVIFHAELGHIQELDSLLNNNPQSVDVKNMNGETALHKACANKHIEVAKLLLDRGANVNELNVNGRTALILSAWRGHIDLVHVLLERGANINLRDNWGWSAVMYAIRFNFRDTVVLLIDKGASLDITSDAGFNTLEITNSKEMKALIKSKILASKDLETQVVEMVTNGRLTSVSELLEAHPYLVNTKDLNGHSLLTIAAQEGLQDLVYLLLNHNANLTFKSSQMGFTAWDVAKTPAIKAAIEAKIRGIVSSVFKASTSCPADIPGIDLFQEQTRGALSLSHEFREKRKEDIIGYLWILYQQGEVLLEDQLLFPVVIQSSSVGRVGDSSADSELRQLMHFTSRGDVEALTSLLNASPALVHLKNENGEAAIHRGCSAKQLQAVKCLVSKGCNVNITNVHNRTPLILSSWIGDAVMVRYLVELRAQLNVKDNWGWSAVMYAIRFNHIDAVKCLVDHGAALDVTSDAGFDTLEITNSTEMKLYIKSKILEAKEREAKVVEMVTNGRLASVSELLEAHPYLVNTKDLSGSTLLIIAAAEGHLDVARYLLYCNAELHHRTSQMGYTAWDVAKIPAIKAAIEAKIRTILLSVFKASTSCPADIPGIDLFQEQTRGALSLSHEFREKRKEDIIGYLWRRFSSEETQRESMRGSAGHQKHMAAAAAATVTTGNITVADLDSLRLALPVVDLDRKPSTYNPLSPPASSATTAATVAVSETAASSSTAVNAGEDAADSGGSTFNPMDKSTPSTSSMSDNIASTNNSDESTHVTVAPTATGEHDESNTTENSIQKEKNEEEAVVANLENTLTTNNASVVAADQGVTSSEQETQSPYKSAEDITD